VRVSRGLARFMSLSAATRGASRRRARQEGAIFSPLYMRPIGERQRSFRNLNGGFGRFL
jgi:hypothetical protein